LRECETHGLLAVRLSAVDAKKTRYGSGLVAPSTSVSALEEMSVDVICTTWDTELNARFDKSTAISKALLMTPSERACAMSHVLAWKVAFYSSLWGTAGTGVCKPLLREYEARVAKTPPIHLTTPRSFVHSPADLAKAVSDTEEIRTFMTLRGGSQWINGYYLVMEDDIKIDSGDGKEFLGKLADLTRALPKNTDICYLGYVIPKNAKVTYSPKKTYIKPTYLWQLHAYLLSAGGAKKLLSYLPVNAPVDNFIASLIFEDKLTVCITGSTITIT
jgi:hypothetical protein